MIDYQSLNIANPIVPGTYRVTLSYPAFFEPPTIVTPKTETLLGVRLTLKSYSIDAAQLHIVAIIVIENVATTTGVTSNVVPIAGIAAVLAVLLGIGAIYLSLEKIEKIVESPGVNVLLIAIAAVVGLFLFREFKK